MANPLVLLLVVQLAQSGVSGTVRDELTGGAIESAVITLSDLDRQVQTDERGFFGLGELPPGPHHITIDRPGFSSRTLHALVPRSGHLELNVALRPVPMELDGLTVRPRPAISGVEEVAPLRGAAKSVSLRATRNHPLLSEPDVFKVLEGGDVSVRPESPSGLQVRGGASSHTGYEIDGVPVLIPFHAGGLFSAWNPDALSSTHVTLGSTGVIPNLSGTVVGTTRAPGSIPRGTAAVSSTQARVTVAGPLPQGAGYVLSLRSGFPNGIAAPKDPAKIRGESGDLLAKIELPFFGGGLALLGYDSENEINTGPVADAPPSAFQSARNGFEWRSRSMGATWERPVRRMHLAVRAWDSRGDATAALVDEPVAVGSTRTARIERGVLATLTHPMFAGGEVLVGARLTRGSTRYRVGPSNPFQTDGALSAGSMLLGYNMSFAHGSQLGIETDVSASSLGVTVAPLLTASTRMGEAVTVTLALSRRHQFIQSLRNEESLLSTVFPADLFVTAGTGGVPAAAADEMNVRVAYRPVPGFSLGAQAYGRVLNSVVFVAPGTGGLFSAGAHEVGRTSVRGLSADLALSGSRVGVVANYGFQSVRNSTTGRSYVPSNAPAHRAQAGVVLHASPTWSIRLATVGMWGRRTTALVEPIEWEACNLADNGCELAGNARHGDDLGAVRPGAYLRTDVGLRKHWHVRIGRHDALLAVHGTITNVLNRQNTLNYTLDPHTGAFSRIDMLPFTPLVFGIELGL